MEFIDLWKLFHLAIVSPVQLKVSVLLCGVAAAPKDNKSFLLETHQGSKGMCPSELSADYLKGFRSNGNEYFIPQECLRECTAKNGIKDKHPSA